MIAATIRVLQEPGVSLPLLARLTLLLVAARVAAVSSTPASAVERFCSPRRSARGREVPAPARLLALTAGIGRRLPWRPSCFERSLACAAILAATGRRGRIVVGVAAPGATPFRAHAWLETDDVACDGDRDLTPFATWTFPR